MRQHCPKCAIELLQIPNAEPEAYECPKCGGRLFTQHLEGAVIPRGMLSYKARAGGKGKPFMEGKTGMDLHRKSGVWNRLVRIIDRRNDHYHETITDPKTGTVLHHCDEPLSQHQGHGATKRKK